MAGYSVVEIPIEAPCDLVRRGEARIRSEPFDAVELHLALLWMPRGGAFRVQRALALR